MKFAIRADASLQIGSGHIMRCLTLANVLREKGYNITFICREHDGNLADFIQSQSFNVQLLVKPSDKNFAKNYAHSEWLGVSETDDFAECQQILQNLQPDWLIIDHYSIAKNWQQLARQILPNVKILQIDDLADREHDCDILLDQNFGQVATNYQNLVSKRCRLLLGTRYTLLRLEFSEWREFSLSRRKKVTKPKSILINLGGVDKDNVTLQVLQALQVYIFQNNLSLDITVVMGKTAPHIESVQGFASQMTNCKVIVNANNMAEMMANADIAIGASGSTTWERCCLGLPMILLVLADNQLVIAKALAQQKLAKVVENIANLSQDLPNLLAELSQEYKKLSSQSANLVDGQGATRVANHIEIFNRQKFTNIKLATIDDLKQVWQWRNHEQVRQWMFGQDEIALADHEKWFSKQLTLPNVTLLIFELNGQPMGFVNFTRPTIDKYQTLDTNVLPKNTASWGFYLSPNCPKGHGLGFLLGVLAIGFVFNQTNAPQAITAQVLEYNQASLALHRKLGFMEKGVLKQHFNVGDKTYDVATFELLSENFLF